MATERLALDFGTAETKIYKLGSGMVLAEPTVAAVSTEDKLKVRAVGKDAKKLIGKTAEKTKIVFPMFEGEVVSDKVATAVLDEFLDKIDFKGGILGGSVVVSVPCGASFDLLRKLESVIVGAGIGTVDFVEAPILSALGQELTLTEFSPYFIIDMGAGNTNIAAVSLEGVIAGISVNMGGNGIDTALIDFIAEEYGMQIGLVTAEKLKVRIGSLVDNDTLSSVVNGRDLTTGKPRSISISARDIKPVVEKYYSTISELALKVLAKLPPEVSAEIRHAGIYLSGGGAKIYGLEDYFTKKFGMQVTVAKNPSYCTAFGGGIALGNPKLLKKIKVKIG
ncbi:MAG: rod shape-determining protein [Clostridia bacterium]|nr:rod shape-determining protein [Clostridia bacterium]